MKKLLFWVLSTFLLCAVSAKSASAQQYTQPAQQCVSFSHTQYNGYTIINVVDSCTFTINIIQVANNGHFIDPEAVQPGKSVPAVFATDHIPYVIDACRAPGIPSNPDTNQFPPRYNEKFSCPVN